MSLGEYKMPLLSSPLLTLHSPFFVVFPVIFCLQQLTENQMHHKIFNMYCCHVLLLDLKRLPGHLKESILKLSPFEKTRFIKYKTLPLVPAVSIESWIYPAWERRCNEWRGRPWRLGQQKCCSLNGTHTHKHFSFSHGQQNIHLFKHNCQHCFTYKWHHKCWGRHMAFSSSIHEGPCTNFIHPERTMY